ncbi:unnamed protein product [Acanthosepion pharaonis]|uniref:Uncharacterized protein n=1 Tax=Acanthosepion pharaonis TaxID=158019 RepID=A0A812C989_ACAPH|nr:unnamed protein product [Sepia pharaonis]
MSAVFDYLKRFSHLSDTAFLVTQALHPQRADPFASNDSPAFPTRDEFSHRLRQLIQLLRRAFYFTEIRFHISSFFPNLQHCHLAIINPENFINTLILTSFTLFFYFLLLQNSLFFLAYLDFPFSFSYFLLAFLSSTRFIAPFFLASIISRAFLYFSLMLSGSNVLLQYDHMS